MPVWKGKTRGGSFGYQFFIYLMKYVGLRAAYLFLSIIVLYFIPSAPKATKSSWFYWRKIHRKKRLQAVRMLYIHYYRFGQVIIDKITALAGFSNKFQYDFHNYNAFLDILNGDTGVVMIGAHFGNWEIGRQFFGDYAKKLNLVMYDAEYQKIKEKLQATMGENTYRVIVVNEDSWSHVFAIKEALDKKEYICFQGDRFVSQKYLMKSLFLGKEAYFPAGPFQIASRFKVPVVFYFSEKENTFKYSFRFFIAGPIKRTKELKPEQALLNQYISVLESRIKVHPEQWFNFYPFWDEK